MCASLFFPWAQPLRIGLAVWKCSNITSLIHTHVKTESTSVRNKWWYMSGWVQWKERPSKCSLARLSPYQVITKRIRVPGSAARGAARRGSARLGAGTNLVPLPKQIIKLLGNNLVYWRQLRGLCAVPQTMDGTLLCRARSVVLFNTSEFVC